MAESALIEVFGPLEDVSAALLALSATQNERYNRVGCLMLDVDDVTITVGDSNPTGIDVTGHGDVMPTAGTLYRSLASRTEFPMQLFDAVTDQVVQARGEIPAA